jgi:acyl transferase domain-containing protein
MTVDTAAGPESRTTRTMSPVHSVPVAVVGLACRAIGVDGPEALRRVLLEGRDVLARHDAAGAGALGVPAALARDPRYVGTAAMLPGQERFDHALFGLSLREAELLDPQHRLFLELCREALEDAAWLAPAAGRRVGVFGGCGSPIYLMTRLAGAGAALEAAGATALSFAAKPDFLSLRVAYRLDLRGPAMTVQTGCSTGMSVVQAAMAALAAGECEAALAGAACLTRLDPAGYLYHPGAIESPTGRCRPFDAAADGTVGGSGGAVVLLKRLADAERDGDHIHAVIRAVAITNDGGAKIGFTAPGEEAQAEAVARAFRVSGINPDTIGCVEAHGTATALGDPIELAALTRGFRAAGGTRLAHAALGSVKGNLGHADAAAGMLSIAKAVLSVAHGEIYPTANTTTPNPELRLAETPFRLPTAPEAWPAACHPRRMAVNCYGMGGTNLHAILEQAPAGSPRAAEPAGPLVFVLSAADEEILEALAARMAAAFTAGAAPAAVDVAFSLATGRPALAARRAVVAQDLAQAARLLTQPGPALPVLRDRPVVIDRADAAWAALLPDLTDSPDARGLVDGVAPARLVSGPADGTDPLMADPLMADPLMVDGRDRLQALARLWCLGVRIDWAAVFQGSHPRRVPLPVMPYRPTRCWIDLAPAEPVTAATVAPAAVMPAFVEAPLAAGTAMPATIVTGCAAPVTGLGTTLPLAEAGAVTGRVLLVLPGALGLAGRRPADPEELRQASALRARPGVDLTIIDTAPAVDLPPVTASALAARIRAEAAGDAPAVAFDGARRLVLVAEAVAAEDAAPLPDDGRPAPETAGPDLAHPAASAAAARLAALPVEPARGPALDAALDRLCAAHSVAMMRRSGVDMAPGAGITRAELDRRIGLVRGQGQGQGQGWSQGQGWGRMLDAALADLAADGLLTIAGDRLIWGPAVADLPAPDAAADRVRAIDPDHAGLVALIDHCMAAHGEVFAGRRPATTVIAGREAGRLFTGAGPAIERHSSRARVLDAAADAVVAAVDAAAAAGRTARIVEVGGGTGAFTGPVLDRLAGRTVDYLFTDVSGEFVARARATLAARGLTGVRVARFDVSRDPADQGLEVGGADLVLALDVIHATADLRVSLDNVARLLRPGGLLLLAELVVARRWVNAIWGLATGWWVMADDRTTSPLIDPAAWRRVLEGAGFATEAVLPDTDGADTRLFIARNTRTGPAALALHEGALPAALPQARRHVLIRPVAAGDLVAAALAGAEARALEWATGAEAVAWTGEGRPDARQRHLLQRTGAAVLMPAGDAAAAPAAAPVDGDAAFALVAGLWHDLLGVTPEDAAADFYAAGGDSLIATRMLALLAERHGLDLPATALFAATTAGEMAGLIRVAAPAADAAATDAGADADLLDLLADIENMSDEEIAAAMARLEGQEQDGREVAE